MDDIEMKAAETSKPFLSGDAKKTSDKLEEPGLLSKDEKGVYVSRKKDSYESEEDF